MAAEHTERDYARARERYAEMGVDTEAALAALAAIPVSFHCWQGDDVGGFEDTGAALGGGLAVTGNYPGKARTADELRRDADAALAIVPGTHRFSLHASYLEAGRPVERNDLRPEHFAGWADWACDRGLGLDFNPTYFAHPLAESGFTLAHADAGVRRFWVEHGIACRKVGASFGDRIGRACVTNFWVPDGYKDTPADRRTPRERLARSLDEVFADPIDPRLNCDAVESKLFGIGSESYVVGSHEFYLGYAIRHGKLLCLDAGHFHPTEGIADKISAVLMWLPELLLHVSRGLRWDSDHVVTLTDDLRAIAQEVVRGEYLGRVRFGLDYFDASINRVAAWVIGARCLLKALLAALIEPTALLRQLELAGDFTGRLAVSEELKTLPLGAVWDHYCHTKGVPVGRHWLDDVRRYEREVLANRT
ncbi:L-rhamnose isomerase [Limnoglobus roseus]|uniref:L-rhamnose isomerase n=1 Tax=Limnoglobus roseus TaxID=2598579 RepID=A0A5C1A8A7_9BACT|nr:L-rhamnose isomerase [Limnoglobus roseus]QEL14980.1 L-rhamnose isomerase [Limnoglobus roseus]